MSRSITICDQERGYALRLMEYFYERGDLPCEVRACTEPGRLRELSPPQDTALLIITDTALEESGAAGEYGPLLLLREGLSDVHSEASASMGKYISSEEILQAARRLYLESGPMLPGRSHAAGPLRISGVYAPSGGCLRTGTALALGRILSEEKKTLYLSMEPCSGLELPFRGSLADLVYFSECSRERFASQVLLQTVTEEGLGLLPPMRSWLELRSVTGEEWQTFLDALSELTDCEELVMDLTEHADGFLDLLRRCDRLWIPESGEETCRAKLRRFRGILQTCGAEDVWSAARMVPLPAHRTEGLRTEEIRAWVRGQLEEETHCL